MLVGVTLKVTPLQVTLLIAVIAGVGLILTVTLNTKPVQPFVLVLLSM